MKTILITTLFSLASIGINAQINLIGVAPNPGTGKVDIIKWQALNPESVTVVPSILDGYFYATSAFDAYNGNYYLTGISGDSAGLYAYNSITGDEQMMQASVNTNITEFDMSTGKMYNLKMETQEYISIYEFDMNTFQDSLIGVIYEPGANGIIVDAIGFDANNGILYYVGFTNDPALCLYSIPVRENEFSFTKTILNTTHPFNNITSVNFDNVNGRIYALNATFDSAYNYTGTYVVEIDTVSGDIISRIKLAEFPYYAGGSSSFDQNTGTFMVVGIDTGNVVKMIAYDTYENTYISGFVPGIVSEIVCDNTSFAQNRYVVTGAEPEAAIDFNVWPNPADDYLVINCTSKGDVTVKITSAGGKPVFVQHFSSGEKIQLNVESMASGVYTVSLTSAGKTASQKIIIQ